jgi:phosphinothricin acetyltransferase
MSSYSIDPMSPSDGKEIVDIFNHAIEHSFAAYPKKPVPYEFFSLFLEVTGNHPSAVIHEENKRVAGFGMLRSHNPMPTFRHVAGIT